MVLEAASALRPLRALAHLTRLGWLLPAALLVVKMVAAAAVPTPALASALILAAMLGRWSGVVLCYGGTPITRAPADDPAERAGFGEFGWASLTAFAVTLSIAEAVGLVLLVVAALVTLGIRITTHHRGGGVSRRVVHSAAAMVETAVLLALAALAAVIGR
jgi:hypothetical protein